MTWRKHFLPFVLQLAIVSLVLGRGHREGHSPIILTETSQKATVSITASHQYQEIKIQPSLVSNFDCTFQLQLLNSLNCNTTNEAITIDNAYKDEEIWKCSEVKSTRDLTEVTISAFNWTNPSTNKATFTLLAELYSCPKAMISWTFVITRSLVAVIFVLIPTLVVYLLFYRRQVAIHRARLIREAEIVRRRNYAIAVIDMSEVYANDHPPTYDDVYDTKEPPPCFCEAIGVEPLGEKSMTTIPSSDPGTYHTSEVQSANPKNFAECQCRKL